MRRKTVIIFIVLLIIIVAFLLFQMRSMEIKPEMIRSWVLSFGLLAPFIYILLHMVRPFVLFPTSVLSMVGGLAFGVIPGFIATFIGAMLAAIISFFVARKLGRAFIKKAWSEKMKGVQEQLRKRGWLYVMLLRFVPVINFDLLSYSAALSSIRFQHFLIGTALGIIPGTVVMTLLGSSVVDQNTTAIFVIVTFIVILMIPFLFQDKIKKKLRID